MVGCELVDNWAGMEAHVEAIVKSLVAVAWADGQMSGKEQQVLEALIAAFELGSEDASTVRAYATEARTLADVPLSELSSDDRRLLLQQAVIVTYADGEQCDEERALLADLAKTLHIPEGEAEEILSAGKRRAERLLSLL